ncbi:MAG: hypothetical protein ABIZ04_21510 [Opitutus sp.]
MKIIKTLLVSGVLVLLADLHSAQALPNAQSVTNDNQVPFSGTVFYDLSDELLSLNGWMHVNAQFTPKGAINVRVNLDGVSGTGETSGIRFNAIGGDRATIPFDDDASVTTDFDFRIIPADGFTLSCILRVRLTLTFSTDGTLTDVNIEEMSVVH